MADSQPSSSSGDMFMDALTLNDLAEFTKGNTTSLAALRTVGALIAKFIERDAGNNDGICANFHKFSSAVRPALRHSDCAVRSAALRIILQLWPNQNCNDSKPNPIAILLEAEQCPADFQAYRQRAQLFRKVKFPSLSQILANQSIEDKEREEDESLAEEMADLVQKCTLDVLLAQFYEPFTLYWPLLGEIVDSFAQGMRAVQFWECFEAALDEAWRRIREQNGEGDKSDKTDFDTYRLQLLRLLGKLPASKPDLHTRYLVPKFIGLYREEFMQIDELETMEKPSKDGIVDTEETGDAEMEMPEEENKIPQSNKKSSVRPIRFNTRRRNTMHALKAMLALFARFSNPLGVYREREIRAIYEELLLVNDPEVQRGALACLFAYKHAWLKPYREHLEGLLEEKRVKEQLVLFSVDNRQTEGALADQHRADVMPILLRLLYGLLHTHVATRGKEKRMAILRFLANCLPDELNLFLRLLFGPVVSLFEHDGPQAAELDVHKTIQSLAEKRDIVAAVSLNKLHSVFNSLSDVFRLLGATLDDAQLEWLLTALLVCAQILLLRQHWLNSEKNSDGPSPLTHLLKNLRKQLFLTLGTFFRAFQSRPKLPIASLDALFSTFLGSLVAEQNQTAHDEEGLTAPKHYALPASAVRLFCAWAQHWRWQPLLNVPLPIELLPGNCRVQSTPISLLCDQLVLIGGGPSRQTNQMEILRVLCTLLDAQELGEDNVMRLERGALPQAELRQIENVSFSASLVLAQMDKILAHLSRVIKQITAKEKKEKAPVQIGKIPSVYFDLLSRLSAHIQNAEFGALFSHTLLRYVTNRRGATLQRRQDKAITVLGTLADLSLHLPDPLDAVVRVAPLFSQLDGRQLREALVRFASSLCTHPALPDGAKRLLGQLDAMESWSSRRIEEPDADRRCEALLVLHDLYEQRDAKRLVTDGASQMLPLLAHSHAHSVLQSVDLSLRGTAANCLRQLIAFVANPTLLPTEECSKLVHSHLIPLTLRGLKTSEESIRHEFLSTLATLVRAFPADAQFAPLRAINGTGDANGFIDPDVDFFECAMHIQLHRRQRAFHRLAERLDSGQLQIPHSILLRFIAPIVEPYLMETASNKSALSDQALRLFNAILKRAPWARFLQVLEHYLRQIDEEAEDQKTKGAIRVIVAILDAFHFDLRQCEDFDKELPKGAFPEEEKEDQMEEGAQKRPTQAAEENPKRICAVVVRKLLPRFRECIHPQKKFSAHKRSQKFSASNWEHEEQKLLRAPLTLAVAKMLKWLPRRVGDEHMHSLVLTLNHLLMSRSTSIRQGARKIMEQLMRLLGPKHLPFVVGELKQTLNKGYQIHVMVFTVHALIGVLESDMQPGDLDACLGDVMEVCKWETFGNDKLEREDAAKDAAVSGVRTDSRGVPEARGASNKTAETLKQIGRFVGGERTLEDKVLGTVREVMDAAPRAETLRKLNEWLRSLAVGMRFNARISSQRQLQFAQQLVRTHLQQMVEDQERRGEGSAVNKAKKPSNCLLLPPEPKRLGVIQRVAVKSRVHIFVEFGLQVLADQLKTLSTQRLNGGEGHGEDDEIVQNGEEEPVDIVQTCDPNESKEVLQMLEQFVPLLMECMKQKYDKILSLCLSSLLYLFRHTVKAMRERLPELVDRLFVLLADYAALGQAGNRSAVIELQQNLFKCFTRVIREAPLAVLGGNRIQLLLNYVETDILDLHKQATAFSLVKAIIGRKIEDQTVTNIVEYLSETAITSFSANIRSQCRQTVLLYLTVHPRGQRHYEKRTDFFLNQCEYELEDGRLSALEMVHSIIAAFTEEANARFALLAHMKLSARLLNDESAKCRQFAGLCLRKLLNSITQSAFADCLAATRDWLAAKKPQIRLLAWRILSQFVHCESPHFGPSQRKMVIASAVGAFGKEESDSNRLALCELFASIAEKTPGELGEEVFPAERQQEAKKNSAKRRNAAKRKRENVAEEETTAKQRDWRQFFAQLSQCLLASQRDSQLLALSHSASAFLAQWLADPSAKQAIIRHLQTGYQDSNEAVPPISPLCDLCLSLTAQLDPKANVKQSAGQIVQKEATNAEEQGDVDMAEEGKATEEHQRTVVPNHEGKWDDALAEEAIRTLAHLMPEFHALEHFDLVCKRLGRLCWMEASKDPDHARKRLAILKLTGVLAVKCLDSAQFQRLCTRFIPLVYREMGRKSTKFTEELHSLASEVGVQFRRRLGDREFSALLAQCQRERAERVKRRKQEAKSQFVTDQGAAAANKQRRHERKREAKKRRLDVQRPYRVQKRRRTEEARRKIALEEANS